MKDCDVGDATHVKNILGDIKRIESKSGVDEQGRVRSTREGGFSVKTTDGEEISMWNAKAYYNEDEED